MVQSSRQSLENTLNAISGMPVLVVGDVILDRYIWGAVDRISPEAPVPVLDVKRTEDRLGGAANVARNLRAIGAKVSLCGLIGDDDDGAVVMKLLEAEGIAHDGVVTDRLRPTTVKTRIMAQAQQIVRIDHESREGQAPALRESFAALIDAHIDANKAIVVSDYGKGVIGAEVMSRLEKATEAKRIGLGIRPLMVDPHPANYSIYKSMSIAKPNRKEAEAASGMRITDRDSALTASKLLLKKWGAQMIVLSLGEDGLLILCGPNHPGVFINTVAQQVFDVSGAGDAVVAIFTAAMAAGATPEIAGDLANIGAGVVVSEIGTVPVNLSKLKRDIIRLTAGKGAETLL